MGESLGLTDARLYAIGGEGYRPLNVVGGKIFDFFPRKISNSLRGVALMVGLEELPPPSDSEGDRVDLRLSAPASWHNDFLGELKKQLETCMPRQSTSSVHRIPSGVWILEPGQQIRGGNFWPIWFDHRPTGPEETITLGIPNGREIYPTTEDLIRSSLFAVAKASVNAVQWKRLLSK